MLSLGKFGGGYVCVWRWSGVSDTSGKEHDEHVLDKYRHMGWVGILGND